MKREPKNERGERGRGRKDTLAAKPLDFENLRSPASAAPEWLGYTTCVDQMFVLIWGEPESNSPKSWMSCSKSGLQKALDFLSEQGFNSELRQEQKFPVKQLFTGGDLLAVFPTGFEKAWFFNS